jgi:hypothetical protein
MEEGSLRANVIEAKVNDVGVRYTRMKAGDESEDTSYEEGRVVPAEKIIQAAGFKASGSEGGRWWGCWLNALGEKISGQEDID